MSTINPRGAVLGQNGGSLPPLQYSWMGSLHWIGREEQQVGPNLRHLWDHKKIVLSRCALEKGQDVIISYTTN